MGTFRLTFIDGGVFVTNKLSGKTPHSLYREILRVNSEMCGFNNHLYFFSNYPLPITHKEYHFYKFIHDLSEMINDSKKVLFPNE